MQRMAYPALADMLALGRRGQLAWSLLIVNLLLVGAITVGFTIAARRRGWSSWWALAAGLMAGLLTGTLRDLSDPLAVASVLAGLLFWQRRRRWAAAVAFSVGVLAREPMVLAVVAVALDAAIAALAARRRGEPDAARARLREAWPVVLIPALVFVAWQAYIDARFGGNVATTSSAYLPPFVGIVDEVKHAFNDVDVRSTIWDLAYLLTMLAGIGAAVGLVSRRVTAAGLAALLIGLSLLVLVFGDPWSYTRLSAPMFAALLVGGLDQRYRPALAVCAAGAVLTLLLPLAPWLGSA
jgi:hypothetical protein